MCSLSEWFLKDRAQLIHRSDRYHNSRAQRPLLGPSHTHTAKRGISTLGTSTTRTGFVPNGFRMVCDVLLYSYLVFQVLRTPYDGEVLFIVTTVTGRASSVDLGISLFS